MRTQNEIVNRIKNRENNDVFGFETGEYISFLDFEHAKPFLKDGVTISEWKPSENIRENILGIMLDYMPFAWEKAKDCRGISAVRSIMHYVAWLWLLDDDFTIDEDYQYYGKDELRKICAHYGWDADQWDDKIRVNSESELAEVED